jgi:hypothetical protein
MKLFNFSLNRNSTTFSYLLLCLLIILVTISSSSCAKERSIYEDPDKKIAELIFEKKIVMLADMGHHTIRSYYTLLNVLNMWREAAKLDGNNKSLLLVMETDSVDAKVMSDFIANPNTDSLFYNFYDSWYLDDIEFLLRLREFKLSLDSIKEPLLKFELRGFEQVLNDDFYKIPEKEGDLWFINTRDSITAMNLTNYIRQNPEQNILIFYGGAHLQKGLVEKPMKNLTVREKMGYYLVHYLKKEFGEDNVNSVSQTAKDSNSFKFTPYEKFIGRDILVKSDSIPPAWEDAEAEKYDFVVIRPRLQLSPINRFNFLFSRKNIEFAVKKLEKLEALLPGFSAQYEYDGILEKTYLITGKKFSNSSDLKDWKEFSTFDCIGRLKSTDFKNDLFNYYFDDSLSYKRRRRLLELGFGPGIIGYNITKVEWVREIQNNLSLQEFHNALSVYMLGYPDEQIRAKEILVEFSGKDFPDAFEYLRWYRKEQYNLPY